MNQEQKPLFCLKCQQLMIPMTQKLCYLGHTVNYDFLSCPQCGCFYIPESIVREKMREVEINLEDK